MDQRTCVVIRFRGDKICEMRDYTDTHRYEECVQRHRHELPKFAGEKKLQGGAGSCSPS